MIPSNPKPENYQNERWVYFRPSENKILILSEHEDLDSILKFGQRSVPWGHIVAEIPIHHWLRKSQALKPDLERQLTHASLIAQAPQLLTLNETLHLEIDTLKTEIELLKQIIQRANKTGPVTKFPSEFTKPQIIKS